MLRLLPTCAIAICLLLSAGGADARSMSAKIARVTTAVAALDRVRVQLTWPADAPEGQLRVQATRVRAPELGYDFRDLDWRCPLRRDGQGGWRCDGPLDTGNGAPVQLAVALGVATTDARLRRGSTTIVLRRSAATPDATQLDLTQVPLAWVQALLNKGWADGRITGGAFDSELTITAGKGEPLRIAGPLTLRGAAIDTPDGTIAAENLGAQLDIDARLGDDDHVLVDGQLRGGELLFGSAYVSLQQRVVGLQVEATQRGTRGWQLPRFSWRDAGILEAEGSASLSPDAEFEALDVRVRSPDLTPLRDSYLSAWLGLAGVGDLALEGAADAVIQMRRGELSDAVVRVHDASIDDPQDRFEFAGLDGDLHLSAATPVSSELRWSGGQLYGLEFGAAILPFSSGDGALALREPLTLPVLGGTASFNELVVRPPAKGEGMEMRFGLALDRLDVSRLSAALGWPAFTGELSGRIPEARYARNRLDFDGGLAMQLFGGSVSVSALSMERPFGVAPTLSGDVALEDIDLASLTGAFDFGGITGKLDGRIDALRLVDWQPVAFDAELRTDPVAARREPRVRQRISQRAVQDLSSVGDASIVTSLQGQLIGLFDDFGYSRIGIGCRLADEVCTMSGLGSVGEGFTIVRGSGLPRLTVVGFNRRVDWPTLVERLAAVGSGDVKPVVD